MSDSGKKTKKESLGKELEILRAKLEQREEDEDLYDLVNDLGNVSQSIEIELGGKAIQVPEAESGKLSKEYVVNYLQKVQAQLDQL